MRKRRAIFNPGTAGGAFRDSRKDDGDENRDTGRKKDDPVPVRLKAQRIQAFALTAFAVLLALAAFVVALPVILERLPVWLLAPLGFGAALAVAASFVVKAGLQRLWNEGARDETARTFAHLSMIIALFTVVLVVLTALFHVLFLLTG